jgi:hypothetical protein
MVQGLGIPFDRVTYRDGQLLTARDMQDDQGRNSRLWDLHTRYLHATWGIAIGFLVNTPTPGDTLLQVGPGYAVDSLGRPLVSSQVVKIPVPLILDSEPQVLVMNYQSNSAYRQRVDLDGICLDNSPEQQEAPAFNWKAPADVQMGVDVPLITVQVTAGAVQNSDTRVRRYVQKLQRPYIAAGATDQGGTQWSTLQNAAPTGFTLYQTSIDTSDAAFNNTPYYFPELHMWNNTPQAVYGVTNSRPNTDFIDFAGAFTTCLTNATPTSFVFQLIVPSVSGSSVADPNASGWSVSWVGIEVAQCVPEIQWIINIILNFPRFFPLFLQERLIQL